MIKLFCSVFKISFFIKHLGIVFTRYFDEDGRPNEEELKQKRNEWDKELKQIIKSTLINEELTDDKIQYFFVNLNPKKKLDKGTEEEMKRLKLWIISNDFMNTDIVEDSKHPNKSSILLFGQTGVGKSSLGNILLNDLNAFKISDKNIKYQFLTIILY